MDCFAFLIHFKDKDNNIKDNLSLTKKGIAITVIVRHRQPPRQTTGLCANGVLGRQPTVAPHERARLQIGCRGAATWPCLPAPWVVW